MEKITIAIDGYSGCGKSSTAKAVANSLGYAYIDSGAMYRAVTLYLIQEGISYNDLEGVRKALENISISFQMKEGRNQTVLNGKFVEDEIRGMEVSSKVSQVSAIQEVRQAMVAQQQEMGRQKGVVMDGRDIGTVVFPQAELKIFMTADIRVRAERRKLELAERGIDLELEEIIKNLSDRDKIDSTRDESPLIKADDAVELDTTGLAFSEQVERVVTLAQRILERS